MAKKNTNFKLGPQDAALVVRDGVDFELIVPHDPKDTNAEATDAALTISILAAVLSDEKLLKQAQKLFEKMVAKAQKADLLASKK